MDQTSNQDGTVGIEQGESRVLSLPAHLCEPEKAIQRFLLNNRPAASDLPERTFKAALQNASAFLHQILEQSDDHDLAQALKLVEAELQNLTRLEQARGMVLQA